MLSELEKLSLTLDTLTKPEARRIIDAVTKILTNMLNPHIIDLIWKEEGKNGAILRPYIGLDKSRRGEPKAYQVGVGQSNLWAWAQSNRKSAWLENVRSLDRSKPVKNVATEDEIDPQYLNIYAETDSIMVVPLFFRDVAWGVFAVELPIAGKFTQEILELIERVAKSLALIVWKAETFALNQQQTSDAIRLFTDSILEYEFQDILTPYRTGFIARPFTPEFNNLEACVKRIFEKYQIQARHYVYRPGTGIAIEDIMNQIRFSHFGVADITGCNPNVMVELGMFMMLRKKFVILRQKNDTLDLPFDIRPYFYTDYIVEGDDIQCWDSVDNRYEPMESVLTDFIKELSNDPNYVAAKPWNPSRLLR